jgi:hypothetical protein
MGRMTVPLEEEARALIRKYRMNWDALRIVRRQEHSLGVGVDSKKVKGATVCFLFRAGTSEVVGTFADTGWAEILILREAIKVFGDVMSSEDAARQYEKLVKETVTS